jgi:hypothetical protein
MKVLRRGIGRAQGPGAGDGQPLAMSWCNLAGAPDAGSIKVADQALIAELVDMTGLCVNSCPCDALHDMALRYGWVSRGG